MNRHPLNAAPRKGCSSPAFKGCNSFAEDGNGFSTLSVFGLELLHICDQGIMNLIPALVAALDKKKSKPTEKSKYPIKRKLGKIWRELKYNDAKIMQDIHFLSVLGSLLGAGLAIGSFQS